MTEAEPCHHGGSAAGAMSQQEAPLAGRVSKIRKIMKGESQT